MAIFVVVLGIPATAAARAESSTPSAGGSAGPDAKYYGSTVTGIQPATPGLTVSVQGRGNTVTLTNTTGKSVVVEGYAGEDYLRFSAAGVEENSLSLTTKLNQAAAAGTAPQGVKFSGQGKPQPAKWQSIAQGNSYTWHDYRTRWASSQRPPSVVADPHKAGQVFAWAIELKVDSQPTLVHGAVTWSGTPVVSLKLKIAIAVAVLAVLLLIVMMIQRGGRRRNRAGQNNRARVLERTRADRPNRRGGTGYQPADNRHGTAGAGYASADSLFVPTQTGSTQTGDTGVRES
jgi:hypothetical protein